MSLPSEQNWLIVFNLLTDLTKKGYDIPKGISPELGLIRSSISSYKKDPSHPDLINSLAKAEMSLNNIQEILLELALEEGEDYVDGWLSLFKDAMHGKKIFEFPKSRSTFIVNTPPGLKTGRITLKKALAEERVQEIAEWNGLIIEFEDDVTVDIHGDEKDLKTGLQEMGSFFLE